MLEILEIRLDSHNKAVLSCVVFGHIWQFSWTKSNLAYGNIPQSKRSLVFRCFRFQIPNVCFSIVTVERTSKHNSNAFAPFL